MADIKNLTVLPRPRSAWQAMDAGFTLARAHYVKLVILWLGFSIPVFLACAALQLATGWSMWSLMLLLWWWFKPLYELPIHLYLSRALFSEELSLRETWKLALSHFGKLFKTYLTLARLSPARALTYGVVFLEQLPRKQRGARIDTLKSEKTRHFLLVQVCFHIEYIMAYAVITAVALLFFSDAISELDFAAYQAAVESPDSHPWLIAASMTSLIAAALVAPFYVTSGFLLYINRRMQLEAWDIEHRFRSIRPRSGLGITAIVLLAFSLSQSEPSLAEDRASSMISPVSANAIVEEILADEDFGSIETRWEPILDFDNDWDDSDLSFFDKLNGSTTTFALIAKALLWIGIAIFIMLLIHTLRQFRRPEIRTGALSRKGRDVEDAKSHPLTQNLPTDIVAAAEHLLAQGERRQALSVLFRGALRAIMEQYDLNVARGATESDCKQSIASVASQLQKNTFTRLLGVWQNEAYANQPQPEQTIASLIDEWKTAFVIHANDNTQASDSAL